MLRSLLISSKSTLGLVGVICYVALSLPLAGQSSVSRARLEKRKQERLRRIAEAERILRKKRSDKEATLGDLQALNKQIEEHEALVSNYSARLEYVRDEITETYHLVSSLRKDLEVLRSEYAQMVRWAYKNRQGINQLTFLFAASSFRDLFLRMKYLSHFAEQRRIQLEAIQGARRSLDVQVDDLSTRRKNQEKLLQEQRMRRQRFVALRKEKGRLITKLERDSERWRRKRRDDRRALARMESLIKDLIARERAKASPRPGAALRLASSFEKNRRRLRWPVRTGIITSKFGKQPHPLFRGIQQDNGGIEIQTAERVSVHAVFDGVVTEIALVPGMNYVVIVQHGNYRTVYARLSSVVVSKGSAVKTQQKIGVLHTNPQGTHALHFEVWRDRDKLNPEKWLFRQ